MWSVSEIFEVIPEKALKNLCGTFSIASNRFNFPYPQNASEEAMNSQVPSKLTSDSESEKYCHWRGMSTQDYQTSTNTSQYLWVQKIKTKSFGTVYSFHSIIQMLLHVFTAYCRER